MKEFISEYCMENIKNKLRFKKNERLCNLILINQLFEKNRSYFKYPFKLIWKESEITSDYPAQMLISVPKRKFKKAVDRNLIRRRSKEIYRHQKSFLYETLNKKEKKIIFIFIYIAKEILEHRQIEKSIKTLLKNLENEINK